MFRIGKFFTKNIFFNGKKICQKNFAKKNLWRIYFTKTNIFTKKKLAKKYFCQNNSSSALIRPSSRLTVSAWVSPSSIPACLIEGVLGSKNLFRESSSERPYYFREVISDFLFGGSKTCLPSPKGGRQTKSGSDQKTYLAKVVRSEHITSLCRKIWDRQRHLQDRIWRWTSWGHSGCWEG